jgi:ATP-dependent Clp protease ATP-binding subunit ClpC
MVCEHDGMTAQADEGRRAYADLALPNVNVANVFENFTERARRVVSDAHYEAYRYVPDYIGTEHLLLGLVNDGAVAEILRRLGLETAVLRTHTETVIGPAQPSRPAHLPYTPRAKKALERTSQEAAQLGHEQADAEHILWALTRDGRSAAVKTLTALGIQPARVRRQLQQHWDQTDAM